MATVPGHYRFTVKEWGDGKPWIAAEPAGDIIAGMEDLGFDLDHGTTLEQAHALANAMNSRISAVHINARASNPGGQSS
jgi:hypothetical protein